MTKTKYLFFAVAMILFTVPSLSHAEVIFDSTATITPASTSPMYGVHTTFPSYAVMQFGQMQSASTIASGTPIYFEYYFTGGNNTTTGSCTNPLFCYFQLDGYLDSSYSTSSLEWTIPMGTSTPTSNVISTSTGITNGPIVSGDYLELFITNGGSNNYYSYLAGAGNGSSTPLPRDPGNGILYLPGNTPYLCATTDPTFSDCQAPIIKPCDTPQSITITSPTSSISNDFSSWVASTTPLIEGCSYNVNVVYSRSADDGNPTLTYLNSTGVTITPTSDNEHFTISKPRSLWTSYLGTTTPFDYTASLQDSYDNVYVAQGTGSFSLTATSTSNIPPGYNPALPCGGFGTCNTGNGTNFYPTPTSTLNELGAICTPPGSWTDIGGGISYGFCTTINYLFVPDPTSTNNIISGDMNTLQTVPPFSWFFQTNSQIANDAKTGVSFSGGGATYYIGGSATGTQATPNNGLSFTTFTGITGATNTVVLLPPDLTTNSFLSDGRLVDDYYNIILTLCILLAIVMVYKIIL